MKLLLDTHAFLWFVGGDDRLGERAKTAIEDIQNERFLSIASIWELAIKHSLGKLQLMPSFHEFVIEETQRNLIQIRSVELSHVLKLADLVYHHRDPFDRMLAVQCLVEDWTLVSADAALDAYGVRRVW